jgi:hypothetical protein
MVAKIIEKCFANGSKKLKDVLEIILKIFRNDLKKFTF